jgi:hypothetical protein
MKGRKGCAYVKKKIVQAEEKRKSSSKRYGKLHNINDKCGGIQEKK